MDRHYRVKYFCMIRHTPYHQDFETGAQAEAFAHRLPDTVVEVSHEYLETPDVRTEGKRLT